MSYPRTRAVGIVWLAFTLACTGVPAEQSPVPTAAPAPLAGPPPVALIGLSATSGDPYRLFENPPLPWVPVGDPRDEGLTLRLAERQRLEAIEVLPVEGLLGVECFADGVAGANAQGEPGKWLRIPVETEVEILFLKMNGRGQIGGLRALTGSPEAPQTRPFAAPRRVKGSVIASSTLTPEGAYHPTHLFDHRLETAWVEGAPGLGEGETITVLFEQPVALVGLEMANGYWRSKDHFHKNARAGALRAAMESGERLIQAQDTDRWVRYPLEAPLSGSTLTLTLGEGHRGTRYEDLVITELRFVDAEGVFGLDAGPRSSAARVEANPVLRPWLDRRLGGVCHNAALKLRSNGSFVAWSGDDMDREVLDGSWEPTPDGLQVFGRRHRVERVWKPYLGEESKEVTKVSGGALRAALVSSGGCPDAAAQCEKGCLSLQGAAISGIFRVHPD